MTAMNETRLQYVSNSHHVTIHDGNEFHTGTTDPALWLIHTARDRDRGMYREQD